MNLTSWDLSSPAQALIVSQTILTGFLMGSIIVVNFIYNPWVKKNRDEEEPEKYEDKYILEDYSADDEEEEEEVVTNKNNIIEDNTPDGNVFMRYNKDNEGFEYWCKNKNIKYDYLDTVARKYCLMYNCSSLYHDRKKDIEKQKKDKEEKEKEIEEKEPVKEKEESIFVKPKKIDTKKKDRSKGEVALKANKYIYKGKCQECELFLKTRDDELERKTKKNMSFADWMSMKR
jgi:hypothetical protein